VKVAVVAEYYPRAHDPVLGIWAHRQALAARDAGADVRVIVLHRPVPPRATPRRDLLREARRLAAQPHRATLDGLEVRYVRFLAPPRPHSYGSWGAWAAPALAVALRRLRREFAFDLVHAHYALPSGDAARRVRPRTPLVISAHGGDGLYDDRRSANVARAFGAARLVLCNSAGTARRAQAAGARATRVVHLGADLPAPHAPRTGPATLVTLGHLVARKRHADVLRALWMLRDRHPDVRYLVIGDGPERARLQQLAADLGLAGRVDFAGQLPHEDALARAGTCSLLVMPSIEEAFGVAYIEAMAGGVPAVGSRGEPGPEEIAAAGDGLRLVPPGDVEALTGELDALLDEPAYLAALGARARATVEAAFTWERCGAETVQAYEDAVRAQR